MPETGRRLIAIDGERVELENFEIPDPGPDQILVRTHISQVSGGTEIVGLLKDSNRGPQWSNLQPEHYGLRPGKMRRPLGYTAVGHVISTGANINEFNPGDRVLTSCSHSTHGLIGKPHDPSSEKFAQHIPIESSTAHHVEFDITDQQAAFAGPLGYVALHGVRRAELQIGESVAVVGQGVVGQMVTAYCRRSGAYPVIAVDIDDDRLKLSNLSGATHTINSSKQDPVKEIRNLTGDGAESIFFVTRIPEPIVDCINAAAVRGKIIIVGAAPGAVEIELVTPMHRELDIRAVFDGGSNEDPHPYMPWVHSRNYSTVMGMISRGDLQIDHLISHVAKPEEANEIYQKMLSGPTGWMSVFFDWND